MNPFWSLLLAVFLVFSVQNTSFADAASHKQMLQKAQQSVDAASIKIDKAHFYPQYHLAAPANWMNDPNGFSYFNGQYHLFYQHNPFAPKHEKMHWGHYVSPDLVHWKEMPIALAPSEAYDKDGVFSGSAIVEDNILYLFYTGHVVNKKDDKTEIHQTQNLAMSKDGINFGKSANNPVINMAPHYSVLNFSLKDFRDPFIWKQSDRYYALVGSQYEKTKDGAVLLFKSKDLRNWVFINITAIGSNGEMGYMWECPSFWHIGSDDVLIISPQGIKPHGKMFLNKYQSGWFVGKLDYDTGKFKQKGPFGLFDYGFDFYAPQVIKTPDGKHILIAWLDMWDTKMPETAEGWAGMMSIPRELKILNGKVVTAPYSGLKTLRYDSANYKDQKLNGTREFSRINGNAYELIVTADLTNAKSFAIKLRASSSQETVLSYDKESKILKLNRDKSSSVHEHMLTGEREASLPLADNLLKLHIFVDKSSVEVFANDGQVVMSSRIYPDKNSNDVKFVSDGEVKIKSLDFYKLKSIHN